MAAEYNGLNELYKIIICVIGFGYVLYFFRDLIIPYVIALFLLYLLRPMARIMKGAFEKCFRSIICCHRCVDHPKEEEDAAEEYKTPDDVEEGQLSEPLTKRGQKNKELERLNSKKIDENMRPGPHLNICSANDIHGFRTYCDWHRRCKYNTVFTSWQTK